MKTTPFIGLVLSISLLSSVATHALSKDEVAKLAKSLQSAPPPELPAKAAEAVKRATPGDRNEVVAVVIRSVAEKRPACLGAVLASIASAVPAAAPKGVAEAARVVPSQAISLAEVAAKAAPGFAKEIGQTVGKPVASAGAKRLAVTEPSGNVDVSGTGIGGGVGGGWGQGVGGGKGHKNYATP